MKIGEGFAQINGTTLYYQEHGSGPALLFLHGAGLDHRMWRRQVDDLAARYRVITCDLRGYGRSAMPSGPFRHYEDASALIEHLGLDHVVVVGHSIGGLYGLELTLSRPDKVGGFVALCMSGLGSPEYGDDLLALFALLKLTAREQSVAAAKAFWRASGWFASARTQPALAAELDVMLDAYTGWYWSNDSPSQNLVPRALDQLEQLRLPVLVIDGELDLDYNHGVASVLAARIPNATLLRIPGAGHMASMEAPGVVAAAIDVLASRVGT